MSAMNLQLGVQFQLLKTDLVAIYEKSETGSTFLLTPTKLGNLNSVTLDEMIADFKKAFEDQVDVEQIQEGLDSLNEEKAEGNTPKKAKNANFDVKNLKFTLKTAYIYIQGDTKEYAFAIEVDCGDAIPDLGFVKLEKLSFKIWNTKRSGILKDLDLDTIENLVKKLDVADAPKELN